MGHTNSTPNYNLPQFVGTDKPTFLGDINGAFLAIDAAIAGAQADADGAVSTANTAASTASGAVDTANSAASTAASAAATATSAASTANTAADTANNAQSTAVSAYNKAVTVGDITDLTTTDKTNVVAAINEINGKVERGYIGVTADGTKTNEQLLNELHALIDSSKMTPNAHLYYNAPFTFEYHNVGNDTYAFTLTLVGSNALNMQTYNVAPNNSSVYIFDGTTYTDASSSVPTVGTPIRIYY